jgi:hypothetical protein
LDAGGNLYISQINQHVIRMVNPAGTISTIAGTGNPGFSGDGGAATAAMLFSPEGLAVDKSGNVYGQGSKLFAVPIQPLFDALGVELY